MRLSAGSTGPSPLKRVKTGKEEGDAWGCVSDEEMARRLHEQLNGPESPVASGRHIRTRKKPTFYQPAQVCAAARGGCVPRPLLFARGSNAGAPWAWWAVVVACRQVYMCVADWPGVVPLWYSVTTHAMCKGAHLLPASWGCALGGLI